MDFTLSSKLASLGVCSVVALGCSSAASTEAAPPGQEEAGDYRAVTHDVAETDLVIMVRSADEQRCLRVYVRHDGAPAFAMTATGDWAVEAVVQSDPMDCFDHESSPKGWTRSALDATGEVHIVEFDDEGLPMLIDVMANASFSGEPGVIPTTGLATEMSVHAEAVPVEHVWDF